MLEVRLTPAVFAVNTAADTVAANLEIGTDAAGRHGRPPGASSGRTRPTSARITAGWASPPSVGLTLTKTTVSLDQASTGDPDIFGTFPQ